MERRITYLYQSIQDTQNTIRFLDTKASAVLVVHGILIAATASAAQKLVPVFREDPVGDPFFWTFFAVLFCQALSIYFVVLCIRGRSNPVTSIDARGLDLKGTFFVHDPGWKDETWEVMSGRGSTLKTSGKDHLEKIKELSDAEIIEELVGEQLKLSFIRARKHSKIGLAFAWLVRGLVLLALWLLAVSIYFYGVLS
jgi:hypothetical protein